MEYFVPEKNMPMSCIVDDMGFYFHQSTTLLCSTRAVSATTLMISSALSPCFVGFSARFCAIPIRRRFLGTSRLVDCCVSRANNVSKANKVSDVPLRHVSRGKDCLRLGLWRRGAATPIGPFSRRMLAHVLCCCMDACQRLSFES